MDVYGHDGDSLSEEIHLTDSGARAGASQADPLRSLPCSICLDNDVNIHPAVTAGIVHLELASVFLQTATSKKEKQKRVIRRDVTAGKEDARRAGEESFRREGSKDDRTTREARTTQSGRSTKEGSSSTDEGGTIN